MNCKISFNGIAAEELTVNKRCAVNFMAFVLQQSIWDMIRNYSESGKQPVMKRTLIHQKKLAAVLPLRRQPYRR
ncbi:MAG TPA: hypothetical protein DCL38_07355 [Lachnospiraceae bacterium]|nr:hypothetical protein [Lachnospiraceae bacterium]